MEKKGKVEGGEREGRKRGERGERRREREERVQIMRVGI